MSILRNKLEELEGEEVSISPEVNARIWEDGVERPPAKLEVETEQTENGIRAVLPGTEAETEVKEQPSDESKEEETEGSESSGEAEYDEIVSGTVGEAKEAIRDLEDPDYQALLEAEENNKDRKTLKEFIESQM